jgi:CheY-like chemotaxis protein
MNSKTEKIILLVEDEVIIAMAEKIALEKYEYKVITANSGKEAINLFRENRTIDLILMDVGLGEGIDGPETAITILKERKIPIVFLSSHTEPEIVEKTEKITSFGYIVKNSGITVLDASIKMAFRLFDANMALSEETEPPRVCRSLCYVSPAPTARPSCPA